MHTPSLHAPDGGMFQHALCEEPTGDTARYELDVTCGDCLDLLDDADEDLRQRMKRNGFVLRLRSWEAV